ncbi:hypothetical protein ACFC1B_28490 [Streptomyces xiamenensis]|uniref:hypothetical protein n=1 Tax=Streptomyces xiamenensis TaxID=408015 RepID=UPI0035DC3EDD
MQDPSDSSEHREPEEAGRSGPADVPGAEETTGDVPADAATTSTVVAEVLPGIAVVFGHQLPAEFKGALTDFGLVSPADRENISAVLASVGGMATVGGNLGNAFTSAQGLYRIGDAGRTLLNSGATLAVKDGANLGAVLVNGKIVHQVRWVPVRAMSAARTTAAIGPALAMVALQLQLSEVAGLVKTNIELTRQVLTAIHTEQRAELTALCATVDRAIDQAREIEAVPASLWENVAGSEASLRKQLNLYSENIVIHVARIDGADARRRREYLQAHAEAIVFDTFALLDSLKAWTGYQALRVGRARDSGRADATEARYADVLVRDTRAEFDAALAGMTGLVASLTRELRVIALLTGRETRTPSLTGKQRNAKTAREISGRLLEAIEPLARVLHPPAPPLTVPEIVCAPGSLDPEPYLGILRWFLQDGETLRALGFPEQLDSLGPLSALLGGAKEKLAAVRDKPARTLVAVTDRRVITARTTVFLEQGEIAQDIPIDQVRYVRSAASPDKGGRVAIDLITRDENIRWLFPTDIGSPHVHGLAAVLAESMTIPDAERRDLRQRGHTALQTGTSGGEDKGLTEPSG